MMSKYGRIEMLVGLFVLMGILSLCALAFKVSGLTSLSQEGASYHVTAAFTEIGGLKVRARVAVAGVPVGRVTSIKLDENGFQAIVTMSIHANVDRLPTDTIASIATSGLIGDNYVMLAPGADDTFLKDGSRIELTDPAIVLERLIGQFLYRSGQK
jgi:phospholipid/cholesterol/gamma-HCH transport system substrate-binding protein